MGKTAAGGIADEYVVGYEDEEDEEESKYGGTNTRIVFSLIASSLIASSLHMDTLCVHSLLL